MRRKIDYKHILIVLIPVILVIAGVLIFSKKKQDEVSHSMKLIVNTDTGKNWEYALVSVESTTNDDTAYCIISRNGSGAEFSLAPDTYSVDVLGAVDDDGNLFSTYEAKTVTLEAGGANPKRIALSLSKVSSSVATDSTKDQVIQMLNTNEVSGSENKEVYISLLKIRTDNTASVKEDIKQEEVKEEEITESEDKKEDTLSDRKEDTNKTDEESDEKETENENVSFDAKEPDTSKVDGEAWVIRFELKNGGYEYADYIALSAEDASTNAKRLMGENTDKYSSVYWERVK